MLTTFLTPAAIKLAFKDSGPKPVH